MRILISSLQVSQGASKGHLHPAIEIGLELKRRGHEVAILPLPNPFNEEDRKQLARCDFAIIEPPPLPQGLPLSPQELGELAKYTATTAKAYHSFLVAPLEHQFAAILEKIKQFNPDIIVYDLLVYATPLAARLLEIPDMGYCAGLKLAAPPTLTAIYQSVYWELAPLIQEFLDKHALQAHFHHLELLSTTAQLVFTPAEFISNIDHVAPPRTTFVGSLPISHARCETGTSQFFKNHSNPVVLCFGSVLDPTNYPDITHLIIKVAAQFNQQLIISTRKPHLIPKSDRVISDSYLPLPQLLKSASIFIHHGGANTFSESLTQGVPQILIPLTTDQPIQAELLQQSKAGIAIYPHEVTEEKLYDVFAQLLNMQNPIHQRIHHFKQLFEKSNGAANAGDLIEATARNYN